jgi:threonine dehydrogenase-like Zn-dependent dehydrogenase
VSCCGVCGTDAHIHDGEFFAKFPLIPGHEAIGKIVEMGKNVKGFSIGDRCVADVGISVRYYLLKDKPFTMSHRLHSAVTVFIVAVVMSFFVRALVLPESPWMVVSRNISNSNYFVNFWSQTLSATL